MDATWGSLLSGFLGAALALVGTFWIQYYFKRRDERQQADRERIATVLDFTGRARGMVMWAAYAHAHINVTRQWRTQPALLLGQIKAIDAKHFTNVYIEYVTDLTRLGGRLIAAEGWDIKPAVDEIAAVASELVTCYISPADSRARLVRWVLPATSIDEELADELLSRLLRLSADLEQLLLGRCRTMEGHKIMTSDHHRQPDLA